MVFNSPIYEKTIEAVAFEIPISDRSVLITGASGLIGSCIVDVLSSANRLFDKNIQIYAMGRDENKLALRFGTSPSVRCISQSVTEPIEIEGLDYIIHAASNADPRSYALYPVETILTNVLGAQRVLEYLKTNKSRALLASSFEVYGKLEQDEYEENEYGSIDLNPIRSCYPESKRTAEMLFRSYFDEYGVDCVIARLASIYGPTMQKDDSKAHAQFLRNALEGKDIVLKSNGSQKRSYCYVVDAVSGLLTVLFKGQSGEIYNVANERSVATIAEVAQTIASITGRKIVFDYPDEVEKKGFSRPQNCVLNTDKLKRLGWEGRYDLESGMKETVDILRGM